MSKKSLNQCKTANDFISFSEKKGLIIKNCTKGVKIYNPERDDQYAVIHSNHPHELATGTRIALIKKIGALLVTINIILMFFQNF